MKEGYSQCAGIKCRRSPRQQSCLAFQPAGNKSLFIFLSTSHTYSIQLSCINSSLWRYRFSCICLHNITEKVVFTTIITLQTIPENILWKLYSPSLSITYPHMMEARSVKGYDKLKGSLPRSASRQPLPQNQSRRQTDHVL
jgi:hypothetical protein